MSTSVSPHPNIKLIPFDPNSPNHATRLTSQRIACGWLQQAVPQWQKEQRLGLKGWHWITLNPPNTKLLKQHLDKFPDESEFLIDSAIEILSKSCKASGEKFIPVGHVALDTIDTSSCFPNSVDRKGAFILAGLYLSGALRASGLGTLALIAVEELAVREFGARVILLMTATREADLDEGYYRALGEEMPRFCREDWYEKRGYTSIEIVKDYLKRTDKNGKIWGRDFVWMKKNLGNGEEVVEAKKTEAMKVKELIDEAREKGVVTPTI